MAVFGGTHMAFHPRHGTRASYCIVAALNREEALNIGLRIAHDRFPPDEDWVNHEVGMNEISRENLNLLSQNARTQEEIGS